MQGIHTLEFLRFQNEKIQKSKRKEAEARTGRVDTENQGTGTIEEIESAKGIDLLVETKTEAQKAGINILLLKTVKKGGQIQEEKLLTRQENGTRAKNKIKKKINNLELKWTSLYVTL